MDHEYIPPKLPLEHDVESKPILKQIIRANRSLAELKGTARSIPNQSILINALSLQEAKDSSEIENVVTTHDELYRASVSTENISNDAKEVQRYREALFLGFELITEHKLLLKRHIVQIQQKLENNDAGIRTQSGTVLKNGNGEVIYMPPQNYNDIQDLMDNLEQYINDDTLDDFDPLVKMAIIHYQFESIHPFYDGNGRTGRIINILHLILNGLLDVPVLYLSSYIIEFKHEYYDLLNKVRTEGAWEEWIMFILKGVDQTAQQSIKLIEEIIKLMGETKAIMKENFPKFYSKDLLEILFKHPYTKISFLIDELGVTRKTATNYLKEMEAFGLLDSIKIGREIYFINTKLFKLLQVGMNR